MTTEDVEVQCPHCWERIVLEVDPSVADQEYIEDCSVCCNPLLIHVTFDRKTRELIEISAEPSQ